MPVYKDKERGTYYVSCYTSLHRKKTKRGFKTKKAAMEWEREFTLSESNDLNMTFKSFVEHIVRICSTKSGSIHGRQRMPLLIPYCFPILGKWYLNYLSCLSDLEYLIFCCRGFHFYRTIHSSCFKSSNITFSEGAFLVSFLILRSSAFLFARRRLFSDERSAFFVFCK